MWNVKLEMRLKHCSVDQVHVERCCKAELRAAQPMKTKDMDQITQICIQQTKVHRRGILFIADFLVDTNTSPVCTLMVDIHTLTQHWQSLPEQRVFHYWLLDIWTGQTSHLPALHSKPQTTELPTAKIFQRKSPNKTFFFAQIRRLTAPESCKYVTDPKKLAFYLTSQRLERLWQYALRPPCIDSNGQAD